MKKVRHIVLLLTYCLLWGGVASQAAEIQKLPIRRISPAGGFTLAPVLKISQDRYGFIWFITREKLYQYNSQDFATYNPKFQAGISHTNNYINSLLIDRNNTIWVGTNTGLNRFNYHAAQLETVNLTDKEFPDRILNIVDLKQNRQGQIWMIDGASLATFDPASLEISYIRRNQTRLQVNAFCIDQQGNIYAANNLGEMYHINTQSRQIEKLAFNISTVKLHGLFLIDDTLWITTDGYGLHRYTTSGKLLGSYFAKNAETSDVTTNRIREVLQTSDGKTWIATYKGLLEWNDGNFRHSLSSFNDRHSLPDNSVVSLFEDNQKGLWIGTWRGGLAYLNSFSNTFETYIHSPYENSICGNLVNTIAEDSTGKIWIGTDGHGLDCFDDQPKTFRHVPLTSDDQTAVTNIKCIYAGPNGDIWIGTFGKGIFLRKKGEQSFRPALLGNLNVYDLVSDNEGLWIASFNNGLYYYRYSDQSLKRYANKESDPASLPSNFIRKLLLDASQNLWIISNAGVSIKPNGKGTFERLLIDRDETAGSVQVYTITNGPDGKVWLGTDHGILSLDSLRNISRHPLLFNGKPVSVYGIVALGPEQMWLSSNFGIFSYNPATGSYLNYSTSDGLPGNLFSAGALCHTTSGKIYFGGTTGMVAFDPGRMQLNPFNPNVYFSRIFINHKEVLPSQENSLLEKPLYEMEKLRLKPSQNSFSIEFVALNYLNPQKNQFRYRLKGFDQNWVEAGNNARATYTNIPPGKYVFEVMACNNDGVWNREPAMLAITIPKPLLLSNVALTIYLLLLAALGWLVRRIIVYRSRLERQIELERLQRLQEEKSHQDKLVFFTNISHELRTPLTLISGPVETLLASSNLDQAQYNQLALIKRNARRLLKLINQLLEFRRIENKKAELNICETDLTEFVCDIFNYFADAAKQKQINYNFVNLCDKIPATFDAEKVDKAVFNLLSNAFKFTPEKGSVQVELTIGQKNGAGPLPPNVFRAGELAGKTYVQISVEDSGPGIAPQHLEKIFDRFYKVKENGAPHSGTGIGLHLTKHLILLHGGEIEVESEPGKGSTFRIRIPYGPQSAQTLKARTDIVVNQVSQPFHSDHFSFAAEENNILSENWNSPEKNRRKNDKLLLVVEDHQDLRNFICLILSEDYRVISAANGNEGLEKARIFLPDLIVSDIMMPDKNGIELVRDLKNNLNTSHIPVLLLTALVSDEYKIEGFATGADAYLEKPFNSEVLKARIKNIFATRETLQQFYTGKISQGFEGDMPDTPDQKMLAKAIRFVEKNMTDEQLGIDTLANHLNLSRSTLHRKLKALTNKSATDFIRTIRLEYAARLLKNGNNNIDEVSAMAGFNSHSYFTRSFKEHFGKTPSEFLALHQQNRE